MKLRMDPLFIENDSVKPPDIGPDLAIKILLDGIGGVGAFEFFEGFVDLAFSLDLIFDGAADGFLNGLFGLKGIADQQRQGKPCACALFRKVKT